MGQRLLVIGLDSADAALIEQWMAEGRLPVLAQLAGAGIWGRLRTTAEVMHVSAWPSLYTGCHPGRHGLYHAFQVRAGSRGIHRADPRWRAVEPFWVTLDRAGRRVIVADAFMDAPVADFRGIQIVDYGTWTWFWRPESRPAGILREIRRRFGRYPAPEHSDQVTIPEQIRFRDTLVRAATVKGEMLAWLLTSHPWETAFVMFAEPHGGGHYLWHGEDPDYPLRPRERLPAGFRPLADVYAAVDRAIGRILEAVGEVDLMVVSGDGMGPNHSASHLMPELLHRLGLSAATSRGEHREEPPPPGLAARLRRLLPLSVRQSLSRCLPRETRRRLAMKWMNSGIDWSRTRMFCIPNSNEGYFRLNLAGREPEGRVAVEEAPALLSELAQELDRLVNPENARRIAHAVHAIDRLFPGSERPHLPDLVVSFDFDARTTTRIRGPRSGEIAGPAPWEVPAHYTGNHRPNAFLLAAGPHLRRVPLPADAHILDIAPTILAYAGVPSPLPLDGRPLPIVAGVPAATGG
ncbi:hypothetical protein HRbin40_02380 [bacterium HR40]|nr:hypothetical protein HRbin40_02380 [bacterium HR40]